MLEKWIENLDLRDDDLVLFTGNLTHLMQNLKTLNSNLKEDLNSLLDLLGGGGVGP